jgi:hypothetical protein
MRDVVQSAMTFAWALTLFGTRQLRDAVGRRGTADACAALDDVTRAAEDQLDRSFRSLFRAGVNAQHRFLGTAAGGGKPPQWQADPTPAERPSPDYPPDTAPPELNPAPGWGSMPAPGEPADGGRTGARPHVVLGEGLAAGFGDFALTATGQRAGFAALLTRQMGVRFDQSGIEPPGLGHAPGFPGLPVILPNYLQSPVLDRVPSGPVSNLSVLGLRVEDALTLRPEAPLVRRDDPRQTAANLILGLPDLIGERDGPAPTQLERAVRLAPACAIVALGYSDVLEPAVAGDPSRLPAAAALRGHYDRILGQLRGATDDVLVLTVPDPTDTAYFSAPAAAAEFLRVEPAVLDRAYGLRPDDRVTVPGLLAIAHHVLTGRFERLPPGCVVRGDAARAVSECVGGINRELAAVASRHGAAVFDLHDLFRRVRRDGVAVGDRRLTADYFGGFYSLNGYYPGPTGHAVIAAELARFVNGSRGATYSPPDVEAVRVGDPVAAYRPARGRPLSWDEVVRRGDRPAAATHEPRPPARGASAARPEAPRLPLRLPPELTQELPLNPDLSFHGDGIRIVHCRDDKAAKLGACGDVLFGGLALFASRLAGTLRFRFSPPQGDTARFEITWGGGLTGEDSTLSAPLFFRLPARDVRVVHWPGTTVTGEVDLTTGAVGDLDVRVGYLNSALDVLAKGNPNFPKQPIRFPGEYGSAWAAFEQRPDGRLDFTFHGTTFIPLGADLGGDPVRWPLAFGARGDHPASVPAAGTALHPHLRLSTRESPLAAAGGPVDVPTNTVRELTLLTRDSSFGDAFTLNTPELRGTAVGRSHVAGRLLLQFGERFGDAVPVAVSALPPGGLLEPPPRTPLDDAFPGRLPAGLVGHDEFLRFPLRTYFLDGVSLIEDPFDLALGAVDVRTGQFIGGMLHRGFIGQNLFFALVRTEPRTPQSSFLFRGPARLETGPGGALAYRFEGDVHIPYPEGFKFPAPDLATAYVAGPASALDPYLRLRAASDTRPAGRVRGGASDVAASNGTRFSYRYDLPADPGRDRPTFEYTNHTQGGTFTLTALAWCAVTRPPTAPGDTVTFTGYGRWSNDPAGRHPAAVQVSAARGAEYVSIQIGGGRVSNVNTKPAADVAARAG